MILFCDTSALVKLYTQEQHSDWTREQAQSASHCLVSQIAWAEMCAALALKTRTRQIEGDAVPRILARLQSEWAGYVRLAVDDPLVRDAGELALAFGLRAYDSVQLASARRAREAAGDALSFLCFDKQLVNVAQGLGLHAPAP